MPIFKHKVLVDEKFLKDILEELRIDRNARGNEMHQLIGTLHDVRRDLAAVAKAQTDFVEVIRHFFAHERMIQDEKLKAEKQAQEDLKPGRHDDLF